MTDFTEIFMWLKLSEGENRITMITGNTDSSQVSVQLHLDPHKLLVRTLKLHST